MSKGVGINHLVVGGTDTGKSTFVKSLIRRANNKALLIFDPRNEYNDFMCNKVGVLTPKKMRTYFDDFCEKTTLSKNSIIVYEEATMFLDVRGNSYDINDVLIAKAHMNNYIIMIFHSLRDVPTYILTKSTHMTLFKTSDPFSIAVNKFQNEKINRAFSELKKYPISDHKHFTFSLY